MARKIDPTEEQRLQLKKKHTERRNSLYNSYNQKFKIDDNDLQEASAPLNQVSDIIQRLKNHKSNSNSIQTQYDADDIALLDNDTSIEDVKSNTPLKISDNVTSNNSSPDVQRTISQPVTNHDCLNHETSDYTVNSKPSNALIFPSNNHLNHVCEQTQFHNFDSNDTTPLFDTSTSNGASSINDEILTQIHPLQKYNLINNIFLNAKDLSNVEKIFLVCLLLEMKALQERMSLNHLISKYDFRRATVYQIIPRICNLGYIKIITDNSPKGSLIDISPLFAYYHVSTVLDFGTDDLLSLVRNNNNLNNELNNSDNLNDNATTNKMDTTKRIKLKNSILFLFKTMMLNPSYRRFEHYNEKSIRMFSSFLLEKDVSEETQIDLLGLSLYASSKAKSNDKVVYYLHKTLEKDGLDSLQLSFKDQAKSFLSFANEFFSVDFEEPSLKEIREYALLLQLDPILTRNQLVDSMIDIREQILHNIDRLDSIIDQLPEFRK